MKIYAACVLCSIGYEIVRGLCKTLPSGSIIVLTSRNPELGTKAVDALAKEGMHVKFHQLVNRMNYMWKSIAQSSPQSISDTYVHALDVHESILTSFQL